MIEKLQHFFNESKTELRHVNWPTQREAIRLTVVVIVLSLGLAAFLGAFDYAFSYLLQLVIAP